ncbi:MAG: alpha/beta hydrolase [Burkholderiaceae bacterium]|nr:alpha/beta hydrolase [Burkholderiaceae bacterium]
MPFTSHYLSCHEREIHFTEWGAQHNQVVIAWHGLARTGRDMDDIAAHLSKHYRVICPDTIGRGLSQWSPKPEEEYCFAFYAKIAVSLLDQLDIKNCYWLGTSMGGALGMILAANQLRSRIQRLILNDNAPKLADAAIARIRSYAGNPAAFERVSDLEQYFRTIYKPYGYLTDTQWRRLTETSTRRLPNGQVTPHYDPNMVMQFTHHAKEYDLWDHYDQIDIPVLCLRGAESDLVLAETVDEMQKRGPRAKIITIPNCGHAPALNVPAQFELVEQFFATGKI